MNLTDEATAFFADLQDRITHALADLDGRSFREDAWQRAGGGGGRSRILADGNVFEKAGVNLSDVHGELRPDFAGSLPGDGPRFRATGISLVLHPRNPYVPTVHANFRRIQRGAAGWFGGGADLTPYYVFPEDATHFHRTFRDTADRHDPALYPRFKAWCDRYFFITHRKEPRGVGGVFFDYLGAGGETLAGEPPAVPSPIEADPEKIFAFVRDMGSAFLPAYLPLAERRRDMPFGERERDWQLHRRGRYVEFNLIYDRGTVFGLRTDGRVESILMSLPSDVRWSYGYEPGPGTPEEDSLRAIVAQRDWARG
jgi:coproporphyrinogen III oxidase